MKVVTSTAKKPVGNLYEDFVYDDGVITVQTKYYADDIEMNGDVLIMQDAPEAYTITIDTDELSKDLIEHYIDVLNENFGREFEIHWDKAPEDVIDDIDTHYSTDSEEYTPLEEV